MAKASCLYEAKVFKQIDGQQVEVLETVDLFNLSNIDFEKIIIDGNVEIPNGKGADLPDFSNVEINGEFDCSSFKISKDSVLPQGISVLKCFYSINSLDVLSEILPSSVKRIYVRNALINSVKKDEKDLQIIIDFISRFPHVDVFGKNETLVLKNVIEEIDKKKAKKTEDKAAVKTDKKAMTLPTKRVEHKKDGFLTLADVAKELQKMQDFVGFPLKDIKKMLKTFLYNHASDPQWGNIQNYLPEDKVSDLAFALLNQEEPEQVKEEPVEKQPQTPQVKVEVNPVEEFKQIQITKLLDKNVWGQVCKACKDNKQALINLLKTIKSINLDPLQKDSRIGGGRVACLKDGSLRLIQNLELKNSCYITQGFGRSNNRPRLIWCVIPGGYLIASAFFQNHGDGKNKVAYNYAISSSDLRDKTNKKFADDMQCFLNVDDLLASFEDEKQEEISNKQKQEALSNKQEPTNIPAVVTDIENVQSFIENKKKIAEEPQKPVVESKVDVPLAAPEVIEQPVESETKPAKEQKQPAFVPMEKKKRRPRIAKKINESEILFQASYELEDVFDLINRDIVALKQQLLSEINTNRSIILANTLAKKLEEKRFIEQNLEIAKKTFSIFKRYANMSNVKKK